MSSPLSSPTFMVFKSQRISDGVTPTLEQCRALF